MLSLCMIVKDEEETLENCLISVNNIVDEIIIVDTGSKDRTKEIALKYTEKLFDFKWCDDFAKARNFSITKATNDWILVLDADEVTNEFNLDNIKNFCNYKNNRLVGRIKRINEYEDQHGIKKYIERVNRLFNKNYFKYESIIHEQIVCKNGEAYDMENIDLIVNHIGYTKQVLNRTDKAQRNIQLLIKALKENQNDTYLNYQLGKSYFMCNDYENANKYFKIALSFIKNFNLEYVEDLIESYGYTLINLKLYKEGLKLYNYKKYYSNSPDFLFVLASIEMNNGNFQKAAEIFLSCTEFNQGKIEGITSFLPLYNIGVIFECLGFQNEALNYYNLCREYIPALNRINSIDMK